ncbi:hypothetical protein RBH26_02160 [Natronolimnohabitans sp. A-GB9]|uniref:hypothetical protein n=1 Tax=Natronolimnohabitans sp. A-GB9 TaxID=3069757 RepID=UPI0027B37075|nr:hypothetical protein [Natronolimnohabitans sp. A-GB9]MDQ2049280.1 hypothetical protein [Natronolimnohabitans sp. A-GB9]
MLANREPTDPDDETKRYLVKCETCAFEHTVDGRDEATVIGSDHQTETRHDVVAVEVPPSLGRSSY